MSSLIYYVPIIASAAIYLVRVSEIFKKRQVISGKVQENLTFRLFLLVGNIMTFGSMAEYLLVRKSFTWPILALGILSAIISFKLRWAAIAALGKFWSLHVEIRDNHEFVSNGPFRIVRHPTYFSMILELLAFGLICHAWYMILIIPLGFIPAMVMRLRLEEKALVDKFGPAYREYQSRVPMLIPYKWPSSTP